MLGLLLRLWCLCLQTAQLRPQVAFPDCATISPRTVNAHMVTTAVSSTSTRPVKFRMLQPLPLPKEKGKAKARVPRRKLLLLEIRLQVVQGSRVVISTSLLDATKVMPARFRMPLRLTSPKLLQLLLLLLCRFLQLLPPSDPSSRVRLQQALQNTEGVFGSLCYLWLFLTQWTPTWLAILFGRVASQE